MKKVLLFLTVSLISLSLVAVFSAGGCRPAPTVEEPVVEEPAVEETITIKVFTFGETYAVDDWVYPFEEKYNAKVERAYAGTVEEFFSKTLATPKTYNLVTSISNRVPMYYEHDLIQGVDKERYENWDSLDPFFQEGLHPDFEPGKIFYVPQAWGIQGIIVNMDAVGEEVEEYITDHGIVRSISFDVLKDPRFKGQTALFDEACTITNMAAVAAGVPDPFNLDDEGYEAMASELRAWAENARALPPGFDAEKDVLVNEDAYISLTGNDAMQAIALPAEGVGDKFEHFLPTEGSVFWVDGWVITKPTTGAILDMSIKWADWTIGEEAQKMLAELVGWGTVNPEGKAGMADEVRERTPWYAEETLEGYPVPLHVFQPEEDPPRRERTWMEIKAAIGY